MLKYTHSTIVIGSWFIYIYKKIYINSFSVVFLQFYIQFNNNKTNYIDYIVFTPDLLNILKYKAEAKLISQSSFEIFTNMQNKKKTKIFSLLRVERTPPTCIILM